MKKIITFIVIAFILIFLFYRNQSQPVPTSTQQTESQTATISDSSPKKETKQTPKRNLVSQVIQGQLLMGTVYDWFSKEPIANVLIYRDRVHIGNTNAQGVFKLDTSPYQELEFSADGYTHETLIIQEHHFKGNPGIFLYPKTGSYSGEVQDLEEKPIADATVSLLVKDGEQAVMETDLQGRFSFQALKLNQRFSLKVTHPLYEQASINMDKLVKPENQHKIIQLKPRRSVYGRMLSHSKKPLADLDLKLFESPYAQTPTLTQTHKDGYFRFELDSHGTSYLFFASWEQYTIAKNISVPANEDLDMGTIILKEGHPVKGHVFDEQNQPIEAAEVMMSPVNFRNDPPLSTTLTQSNGAFETIHFPLDTALVLKVKAKGFKTLTKTISSPSEKQNIILKPVHSFKVQVLDPQENPVNRAQVRLIESDTQFNIPTKEILEEDNGIAVFDNVKAGEYRIFVTAPGMIAKMTTPTPVPNEDLYTIKLEEGANIWGYVYDENNKPVPEAYVWVKQDKGLSFIMSLMLKQKTETDANGFYFIDSLKPDLANIVVGTDNAESGLHTKLDLGANHVDLQLIPKKKQPYSISGQVIDHNNQPVAKAMVRASSLNDFRQKYCAADGSFIIDDLKAQDYQVSTYRQESNTVDVTITNQSITDVIIKLKPKKQIIGKVIGVAPEEMNKVEIHPFNHSQSTKVNSDGSFVVQDLKPRKYNIAAVHSEKKLRATASVDLSEEEPPILTLELKPTIEYQFKVNINGNPVANTEFKLEGDLFRVKRYTDDQGHVIFKNLSPGTYYLSLSQTRLQPKELTIDDNGFSEVHFQSFKLSGYVLDKNTEKPIPGANLGFFYDTFHTDDQGYFILDGLNEPFNLRVSAENYSKTTVEFDMDKDEVTTIFLEPANYMQFQVLPPIGMTYADMKGILTVYAMDEQNKSLLYNHYAPDVEGKILVDKLPEFIPHLQIKWSHANQTVHNIEVNGQLMQIQLEKDGRLKLPPLNTEIKDMKFTCFDLNLASIVKDGSYPKEGKILPLPAGNYSLTIHYHDQEWTHEVEVKPEQTTEIPVPIHE